MRLFVKDGTKLTHTYIVTVIITYNSNSLVVQHVESSTFRPICQVEQFWAWLVLGSEMAWESQALLTCSSNQKSTRRKRTGKYKTTLSFGISILSGNILLAIIRRNMTYEHCVAQSLPDFSVYDDW
uniref:Uncharacterized protein n=1 Tax=Onchocerca volvulus TaxID=6282 RepID=A0A8R1TJX5_ONCVO